MEEGGAPKKRHSPHPDDVNFDKAGLLDEIKEKPSGISGIYQRFYQIYGLSFGSNSISRWVGSCLTLKKQDE